jgi:hypothetical protein
MFISVRKVSGNGVVYTLKVWVETMRTAPNGVLCDLVEAVLKCTTGNGKVQYRRDRAPWQDYTESTYIS